MKPPFFIVGAQRSGTTLLRLMLNSHSALAVAFEANFLRFLHTAEAYSDLSQQENRSRLLDDFARDKRIHEAKIVQDRDAILRHPIEDFRGFIDAVFLEYAKANSKRRWGVKVPGWVTCVDEVWRLFPGCQIIHLVRDGRDVALSLQRVSWGVKHIPRAAEDWRWKVTLAHKMGRMIARHYCEVHFEDLVLYPEDTLRTVCSFLGVTFESAILDYHRGARSEMPDRSLRWHRSSVARLDSNKVLEWKRRMSKSDRIIFDQIAGDALELFGYERFSERTVLSRAKWLYYTLLQRW